MLTPDGMKIRKMTGAYLAALTTKGKPMTDIAQMCEALRFLGRDRAKAARGTCYEAPAERYVECRAADLIEKLSAAPPASVGWQPIETAPRDGTEILVAVRGRVILTAFDTCYRTWPEAYWQEFTHWMPLPTPPEGEG